jgi:hypothetical protein
MNVDKTKQTICSLRTQQLDSISSSMVSSYSPLAIEGEHRHGRLSVASAHTSLDRSRRSEAR